jgi:hypothetical protein
MTLMARYAGLPARYAEGYSMTRFDEENGQYYITQDDAHAFPEVYISGYGWMSFEPTIASAKQSEEYKAAHMKLKRFIELIMILAFIITAAVLIIFASKIDEAIFRVKLKISNNNRKTELIIKRLKRQFKFNDALTTREISEHLKALTDVDFTDFAMALDKLLYIKNNSITDQQIFELYNNYLQLYKIKKNKNLRRKIKNYVM